MTKSVKFLNQEKSTFLLTLKERVDAYFKDRNVSKHANSLMVFKTVFFVSIAVALYVLIITSVFPLLIQLFAAILLGMTMAFIGFNVCHDALHGAYSSNKNVNNALGFIF